MEGVWRTHPPRLERVVGVSTATMGKGTASELGHGYRRLTVHPREERGGRPGLRTLLSLDGRWACFPRRPQSLCNHLEPRPPAFLRRNVTTRRSHRPARRCLELGRVAPIMLLWVYLRQTKLTIRRLEPRRVVVPIVLFRAWLRQARPPTPTFLVAKSLCTIKKKKESIHLVNLAGHRPTHRQPRRLAPRPLHPPPPPTRDG